MSNYYVDLILRHRNRGIIVDTNILVLLFVGATNPALIPTFNRTKNFTIEDYETLQALLGPEPVILTTPHIITETSNFLGYLTNPEHDRCFELFAQAVSAFREYFLPSKELAETGEFQRFGVTDAGLIQLAAQYLILTIDFPLSNYVSTRGVDIVNFNYISSANWR